MRIDWHESALSEFADAALYYGNIDEDLGWRFSSGVEVAIAQIKARPVQARKFDGQARKVRVKRFPFAVIYLFERESLQIISVMHMHREPGYWRRRM